jgi:hypothetical protein
VDYFAKKSYYVATNPDHLKIQIKTFHDLLQELTCPNSIALRGLKYILAHFDKNITTFADMFAVVPSFGAKFLYNIDRSMQFFFKAVQNAEHVEDLADHVKDYLVNKAEDLMDGILESRAPIDIVLPACLMSSNKPSGAPSVVPDHPVEKRGVPIDDPSPSKMRPILNENAEPTWKIPSGKRHSRSEY